MRVRVERFGAWVRLDRPDALVALDRDGARRLGVDGAGAWDDARPPAPERPIEVHVAVTARCPAGCEGCYLDARPDGDEPSRETIEARLRDVAAAGAFTVAFGGGEPLSRGDVAELAAYARSLGLAPVMTTSGIGLTAARAATLRAFAQVNVSHDGAGEAYAAVRGWDGARVAERAIALLCDAGVPVGVNTVLTRDTFAGLEATAARVASLGARELQLLRWKPSGRAASLDYLARRLSPAQVAELHAVLGRIVAAGALSVRVDCALVPLLSGEAATPESAALLAGFGVLGCEAGRRLAALRVDGRASPCSFAEPSPAPGASIASSWGDDAAMDAFRAHHAAPPEPCASCPLRPVCRGGCQVVSRHLTGGFAPDPECPRVRAWHARAP